MESLGLLSSGLFSGMTIVVAGYVSNTHPLPGAGSIAVLLSVGNALYPGIAVITPGSQAQYPSVTISNGNTTSINAIVTFSGDKLTSNAGLLVNAMILA